MTSPRSDNPASPSADSVRFADSEAAVMLSGAIGELADPEAAGWERIKRSHSRTIWRGVVDGRQIYVKQFHVWRLSHSLRRMLGLAEAIIITEVADGGACAAGETASGPTIGQR